jgi:hypothetical protein
MVTAPLCRVEMFMGGLVGTRNLFCQSLRLDAMVFDESVKLVGKMLRF